jgi:hypothetical protein
MSNHTRPAWATWPEHDLLPDPNAPLYTMDADDFARHLEAQHGSATGGKTLCALIVWMAMNDGSSLDEALTIAEHLASDVPMSVAMKDSCLGAAVLLRTDPRINQDLRASLASSDN